MTLRAEHPLPYLEDAVRRAPSELGYRTLLAEACLRDGDAARAIEILASSLARDATPRTIYVLALALLAADRDGEAKSVATEAIRLNPVMDRAYYVRGRARRSQGDWAGAIADMRAAVDARNEPEYALAFARTAIEAAHAKSPAATPALLQIALRALDTIDAPDADEGARRHLGALLAFALDDPAKAVERVCASDGSRDPKLALLRGYALLAAGRGAEATPELRIARDVPATSAAASRFLTAFRERGRVRPSLGEAILAVGEPSWPEVSAIAPRILPPPAGAWPYPSESRQSVDADAVADLEFDLDTAPAAKSPGSEVDAALERARGFLAEAKHDAAVRELEHAWDLVRPGTSPLPASMPIPRHRLQALAEALSVAYDQSSRGGAAPRRVGDEELYAAGARYPALLRSLVWSFTDDEPREDAFALDILVTAIEAAGVIDRATSADVLKRLAAALRLDVEDVPDAIEMRVGLLERLHRARPGLAFPRLYLGRHAVLSGEPERASAFLSDIGGPLGDGPHVLMLLGACAESMGDSERALALYREARGLAPQIPDLSFRIGRVLIRRAATAAAMSARDAAAPAFGPGANSSIETS